MSPLEIILLNSGVYSDYAAEWVKTHELTDNFRVDATTYRDFQSFVEKKQSEGDLKLETIYDQQLRALQKKLKASEFASSRRELDKLRSDIVKDVKRDFSTYKVSLFLSNHLHLELLELQIVFPSHPCPPGRNHSRHRAKHSSEVSS